MGGTAGTGGGAAGSGGGGTGTCVTACANIASASCPAEDDEATCTADCENDQSSITGCEAEFGALAGCYSTAQITCDTNGDAQPAGCDDQEFVYMSCVACAPATNDDACDTCVKQNCCTEAQKLFTDPDLDAYLECANSCTDEGCINGCTSTYQGTAMMLDAFNLCQDTNCMTDCLG